MKKKKKEHIDNEHILRFPLTMNLMIAFCDIVFRKLVRMVQELHRSRIRCE